MRRVKAPLLWELDAQDAPTAPMLQPEAVAELELIHAQEDSPVNGSAEAPLPVDADQPALFEMPPSWSDHWQGMPDFQQRDLSPYDSIKVQFRDAEGRRAFLELLGEPPNRLRSIWFPQMPILHQSVKRAPAVVVTPNVYPIYVISKGRWETPLTARALEKLGIPYHIVIEPQELEAYATVLDRSRILVLPFANLGQGSIPARNWVWESAIVTGAARHWILDDNIDGFYRLHQNQKVKVVDFNPFIQVEEFTDRYENVALSGMNYEFFADRRSEQPPFRMNTRIYSCILIRNDLPYRWRGRYNEDTDLSIRVLKDGYCTVLFNSVLAKKMPTMTMKGGNTEELYQDDGRRKMAESLRAQHPDVVRVSRKWGRYQHHVDYAPFQKNTLVPVK